MAVVTLSFYDPSNGTLLGTLDDTQLQQVQLRPALYELGAGSFTVSRHLAAAEAAMLAQGVIVAVTIPAIDADPFWAFVLNDDLAVLISHDEQGGESLTLTGPGVMALLGNARLDEETFAPVPPASEERGSSDQVGQWFWRNQAQGAIFTRAVEEGQNQWGTPLGIVQHDFDRTDDSDGTPWSVIVQDYMVPTGTSVLELADRLAQAGEFTAVMRPTIGGSGLLELVLEAHQAYGVDRTASVAFSKGVNILTELNRTTKYTRITHLITRDSDGAWDRFTTANAYDQARYAYLDIPTTNDPDTIEKIATTYLNASESEGEEYELEITPDLLPFSDFDLGDIVEVHTGTGEHDLDHTPQRVVACRIVLDEAAISGQPRSLRIVPELSYREMRGMAGTNSTPGDAGTCCGPRPPLQPQAPGAGTVLFTRSWTYEAGGGTLNSTAGDYPWGDALDGGTQSAFGTHYGRSIGASGSPSTGYIPCAAGQYVRVAGSVARNWFTDTAATKVYFVEWYTAVGAGNYMYATVLDPGPCTRHTAVPFDFTTVVPPGATQFSVKMDQIAVQDGMTVQVIDDDASPGFEGQTPQPVGQPTEGAPGTSTQYMPIDAVIPHGYLAGDEIHQHAAVQVAYENPDLPDVTDVGGALDELAAGGGGGGGALDDLSDVDTSTTPPTDGQALVWDSGASEWIPGSVDSAGGGTPGLLGVVAYAPGSDSTIATSSGTAIADADATNLKVTFTVPPSGTVLVKLSGYFDNSTTAITRWGLRNGSTTVAEGVVWGLATTNGARMTWAARISGLTPGASLTYKWAWRCSAGVGHISGGPTYGQAIMEVWDGTSGSSGDELDYVQITADATITGASEAAANTVITGTSKAYAAVPTLIEVDLPRVELQGNASGNGCVILLYDGATVIGRLGVVTYPANAILSVPFFGRYRLTPSAATHQYIVKAYRTNATATLYASAGGTGAHLPASLRVSRA